jgi:gluconolactonase
MRLLIAIAAVCGALAGQDPDMHIDMVASGYKFTEGPAWSPDGFLLFTDIPNNRIIKYVPGEKPAIFREPSNRANGITFDTQGRLYVCETETRRITRTDRKGKVEVLADKWEGKRLNAPNDIVVRKDGNVYFSDPAFGKAMDTRELDFFGVYRITPKGQLELVAKPKGRPNGVTLSPDGKILYVDNTDERNVRAYDLDRSGKAANERVLISGIEGAPDGMKVDEQGNLYIAAKAIAVYSPEGKLLNTISITETPSNCAFGGPDLDLLYVTARSSVYKVNVNAKGARQY